MGLTQADLSKKVNVTRQTIISLEKGRLNPSILLCLRIAQALNCNINELFYLGAGRQEVVHIAGVSALADDTPRSQNG